MMNHSEWWLHSHFPKRPAGHSLHYRGSWVGGWGLSSPCDGSIYYLYDPTSSTSSIFTVTLPPPPWPPIPDPRTPSPHRYSPGEIPTTGSHSTGDKACFHGRKWFEDHHCFKQNINRPHPFHQWFLSTIIGSHITPRC